MKLLGMLMLETLEPHLVEEIGSSFNQMNEVYVSICECSAGLASLHRRKSRVDKHCIDFGMTVSNDEHLSSYVSARVRACVTLSFGTSVAHGSGKVADLLNLLRLLALRIFSLCESLTSALKKTIAKESCDLSAFNNIVEALTEMTESMVDEIDLDEKYGSGKENASVTVIDVALVVGGGSASRKVPVLVKSILYHRLFKRHCSDYGLVKLVISDILPCEIKRVILLDLDTLVEGNLISLWKSARTFEKEEIIGLIENQSDWYLKGHGTTSWPALGRGYNTGVVLMDLQKMRGVGWNWHWKSVAQKLLKNMSYTSLADQSPTKTKEDKQNRQRGTVKACSLLHMEMQLQRRVFPYFYGLSSNTTANVTLVSQFTMDRLHRLEEIAANWDGPMSLAVYITDREVEIIREYLDSSVFFTSRENIDIHLVFQEGSYYPINALRNTAIKYANTAYIFIVDFDFVPKPHLRTYFQRTLASANKIERVAYIVPAFETFYTQLAFPTTKWRLLQTVASGVVKPFRIDVWQAGHLATNYSHWYKTEMPYEVKWDADFEPYVLIRRGHGQFDEHFVGFGWNKVSFFMLLDALDFKFVVLPNAFIIHFPHAPSVESNRFRHSLILRQCLEEFKVNYVKDLAVRFGVKSLKYLRFRHRTIGI
ncbi:Glycosyltransferase-like protein LARGE2 [Echinococcus granulosus]|uniref:Glycosyltransferase-like protein LARGE2 n=1 Tax=Echinococcus granulosus TaxID=6210 RepID=W6UVU0_ECHGR|nr:Glycosyltransferase-like protein LARGE2 [Echinococcus granulosus]EUB64751.1 Glycosyltransferase-like protein LARGE2 [Echinococcus granulosus]